MFLWSTLPGVVWSEENQGDAGIIKTNYAGHYDGNHRVGEGDKRPEREREREKGTAKERDHAYMHDLSA